MHYVTMFQSVSTFLNMDSILHTPFSHPEMVWLLLKLGHNNFLQYYSKGGAVWKSSVQRGDEQGFFTLGKKEDDFQHNRKQVAQRGTVMEKGEAILQRASVVAAGEFGILLQVKHHQCGADIATDITKQKTRNINCSCDLHFGDCASTWNSTPPPPLNWTQQSSPTAVPSFSAQPLHTGLSDC